MRAISSLQIGLAVVVSVHATSLSAQDDVADLLQRKDDCCFESGYALQPLLDAAGPMFRLFDKTAALRSHVNQKPGTHFPNFGHHAACQRGAMSEPELAPPRDLFGHHAACQRGAMYPTRPRPDHCVDHREHRSTLASSVVAKQRISWWIRSGFEHRPTLASSVVTPETAPQRSLGPRDVNRQRPRHAASSH